MIMFCYMLASPECVYTYKRGCPGYSGNKNLFRLGQICGGSKSEATILGDIGDD